MSDPGVCLSVALDGRDTIERQLGHGCMATVRAGADETRRLRRLVAD